MSNKELLFSLTKKDFRIDTFRSGGKGGQYQNTCDSGVRITHIESGAVGESRDERSQYQNKKMAMERLVASKTFQI
jgi:protein subunit release factor A